MGRVYSINCFQPRLSLLDNRLKGLPSSLSFCTSLELLQLEGNRKLPLKLRKNTSEPEDTQFQLQQIGRYYGAVEKTLERLVCLLGIKRFKRSHVLQSNHTDVVVMIAKMVWKTEKCCWDMQLLKKKKKIKRQKDF